MTEKKVTVRLVMEGGKVVEAELQGIGQKGKTALGGLGKAADDLGKSTGAMRANVGNAAYQVQDFFVQVAGGTSATRALSQQLPQLLGSFGLFGILAGTAAAALIPLIGYLFQGEDQAKAMDKTLSDLAKTISALKSASSADNASILDLGGQYGQYAAQAKEVLQIQKQIAELNATKAFAGAAGAIPGAIDLTGGFGGKSAADLEQLATSVAAARAEYAILTTQQQQAAAGEAAFTDEALEDMRLRSNAAEQLLYDNAEYTRAVKDLAGTFGVTEAAAAQLAVTAAKVGEADNTQDRLAAAQELAKQIWDSSDGLEHASPAAVELYSKLVDAWHAGLDLAAIDIASNIGAGADEAARLAHNLRAVASSMDDSALHPKLTGPANASATGTFDVTNIPGLGVGHRRGGGGGGSSANDDLREAQRLYEQTRTDAEKYATELASINKLHDAGKLDADTYARAVEMIGKKYNEAGDASKFMADTTTDLQSSFIDLAVSGENSFDRIADAIKRAALEAALFGSGPLGGLFGGGKGLLGGLLNFGGGKAVGGSVASGMTYLVGERGPELLHMGSSGSITPNNRISGNSGSGTMNINVNVTGARGDKEIEALVRSGVKQGLAGYDKHVLPSRVRSIAADPRRRS